MSNNQSGLLLALLDAKQVQVTMRTYGADDLYLINSVTVLFLYTPCAVLTQAHKSIVRNSIL